MWHARERLPGREGGRGLEGLQKSLKGKMVVVITVRSYEHGDFGKFSLGCVFFLVVKTPKNKRFTLQKVEGSDLYCWEFPRKGRFHRKDEGPLVHQGVGNGQNSSAVRNNEDISLVT